MITLQTDNLSKSYGSIRAVSGLDLTIRQGEIYGILGPNGSGKSTTLGMLLGVTIPDGGQYTWFEQPLTAAVRKRIGAILEAPTLYPQLSGWRNLEIAALIKNIKQPDIAGVLQLVGLSDRAYSPFKSYSLGMKQRLAIAAALLGDPEVLIFDEPTNGLDPQGIAEVRHLMLTIAAQGKTILLASHIIDEVEKICTHVAILKRGQLIAAGRVSELLSDEPILEVGATDHEALRNALARLPLVNSFEPKDKHFLVRLSPKATAQDLNRDLAQEGIYLHHLSSKQRSLEEEFLERTK